MKMTTAVLSITLAAFIGAVSGYCYRGRVQIAQDQAAYHAFVSAPATILPLAPPGPPAPLFSAGPNPRDPSR